MYKGSNVKVGLMNLSKFRFKGETKELNAETRKLAPGKFVRLPLGQTHYELVGRKVGTPVILVHGFSIPYYIWDPTFEALGNAGFQVLRYDLFGRGYSDRPQVEYDLELFVNQLRLLIENLDLPTPVDLIGLSMGGPITISFCDHHPDLVRRVGLIDPAGISTTSTALGRLFLRPWLGEMILSLIGDRILLSQLTQDLAEPENYPAYVEMAKVQLQFKGYKRALLSTIRNDALSDLSTLYINVGRQSRKTLLIWGVEDKLLPIELSHIICEAFAEIRFHRIEGAGHIPHYERPEAVNPILIEFLSG
jgi:pimeloyl-ACP methyl ester carboxylesterase